MSTLASVNLHIDINNIIRIKLSSVQTMHVSDLNTLQALQPNMQCILAFVSYY